MATQNVTSSPVNSMPKWEVRLLWNHWRARGQQLLHILASLFGTSPVRQSEDISQLFFNSSDRRPRYGCWAFDVWLKCLTERTVKSLTYKIFLAIPLEEPAHFQSLPINQRSNQVSSKTGHNTGNRVWMVGVSDEFSTDVQVWPPQLE